MCVRSSSNLICNSGIFRSSGKAIEAALNMDEQFFHCKMVKAVSGCMKAASQKTTVRCNNLFVESLIMLASNLCKMRPMSSCMAVSSVTISSSNPACCVEPRVFKNESYLMRSASFSIAMGKFNKYFLRRSSNQGDEANAKAKTSKGPDFDDEQLWGPMASTAAASSLDNFNSVMANMPLNALIVSSSISAPAMSNMMASTSASATRAALLKSAMCCFEALPPMMSGLTCFSRTLWTKASYFHEGVRGMLAMEGALASKGLSSSEAPNGNAAAR